MINNASCVTQDHQHVTHRRRSAHCQSQNHHMRPPDLRWWGNVSGDSGWCCTSKIVSIECTSH